MWDRIIQALGQVVDSALIDGGGTVASDHVLDETVDGFEIANALWVGTSGDVVVTELDGTNQTLHSVAAGQWHPHKFTAIVASGTTAENVRAGITGV